MTASVPENSFDRSAARPRNTSWLTRAACLWVGLFPLLHFGTYTTLTRDKWVIMFFLIFATMLCALADGIQHQLAKPARLPIMLGGLLVCWMILSCAFSEFDADTWWIGGSARREGLLTQLCYLLLFFCFCCAKIHLRPVLHSAALGVILFSIVVLLQRAGGNPFVLYPEGTSYALNPEFQGTIGNTDMCTGYLCLITGLLFSFLLRAILHQRPRLPKAGDVSIAPPQPPEPSPWRTGLLCLLGLALSLFLLVTIHIQFGLIALGAMALFALFSFLPRKARIPLLIVLLILILLLVWFWPGNSGGLWEFHEILHGRSQPSFGHNRLIVWQYSLSLSGERPLLGGGSDTFEQRFNAWLRENGAVIPTHQGKTLLPSYFDNPHNEYLAHLVNHGLPSLLLFLALILAALFHPRFRQSPFRLAVFGYAVQAFFSFSVCIVSPIFWVLLGLCFARE